VTVDAIDLWSNSGSNSSNVGLLSGDGTGFIVSITSPTSSTIYRGQIMHIVAYVDENGSFCSGASVNASFNGKNIVLSESGNSYAADYTVPWGASLGVKNLVVSAAKDNMTASDGKSIEVLEEDFQSDIGGDVVVGMESTITINLTFPDNTPVTNASLVVTIGDQNLTFVEVEPGVYRTTYVPDEDDTEMTIHGPGGMTIIETIISRLPGLFDYLNLFKFHIILGAMGLAIGIVLARKYIGI
jgi:hypothetical protein